MVRDILKKREGFGTFHTLFEELKHDREYLFAFAYDTRKERFNHLLGLVRPNVEKTVQTQRQSNFLTVKVFLSTKTDNAISISIVLIRMIRNAYFGAFEL